MSRAETSSSHIGFSSLLRVRYGVVAVELAASAIAISLFQLALPIGVMLALIAATAITNVILQLRFRAGERAPASLIGFLLALDTCILSTLLYESGGPANPFSILYLVYVTLAALMLGARWTWSITALASFGYGALFFVHLPVPWSHGHEAHEGFSAHLQGMWLAFAVSAALIAYFVGRLSRAVRDKEAELARVQEQAQRNERLASLTTLAAGAAHELNTPLSTVAVVAREIERRVEGFQDETHRSLVADARLIRAELERCRSIIEQMSARAGESAGEAPAEVPFERILVDIRESLGPERKDRVQIEPAAGLGPIHAPPKALAQILGSLLKNAFDASPAEAQVALSVERSERSVRFVIKDRGAGMTPEVLSRAVEPFFTTKAPGRGLGLGLFLVQSFADRLGGSFALESTAGVGTAASLELPQPVSS